MTPEMTQRLDEMKKELNGVRKYLSHLEEIIDDIEALAIRENERKIVLSNEDYDQFISDVEEAERTATGHHEFWRRL